MNRTQLSGPGDLVRHECRSCGLSCHGAQVTLIDAAERERVRRLGQALGLGDTLDAEGRLKQTDGHCIFLDADRLCGLHRAYGIESKPLVCRQFPFIALQAEDGLRVGIDPACYHARFSWQSGPPVDSGEVLAGRVPMSEAQRQLEAALIRDLEAPGMTLSRVLALLGGRAAGEGPDPAFSGRLVTRLQAADLPGFFAQPGAPGAVAGVLAPLLSALPNLSPEAPPQHTLGPEADRWAVEVVRRILFLRLSSISIPVVNGAALLMAAGAWACAWVEQDPDRYGTLLAAWARALRYRAFWLRITPDGPTLGWLATGR